MQVSSFRGGTLVGLAQFGNQGAGSAVFEVGFSHLDEVVIQGILNGSTYELANLGWDIHFDIDNIETMDVAPVPLHPIPCGWRALYKLALKMGGLDRITGPGGQSGIKSDCMNRIATEAKLMRASDGQTTNSPG